MENMETEAAPIERNQAETPMQIEETQIQIPVLQKLPSEILTKIMRAGGGLSWDDVAKLGNVCKELRRSLDIWEKNNLLNYQKSHAKRPNLQIDPKEDGSMPIAWSKYRKPMSRVDWSEVRTQPPKIQEAVGKKVVDTVWLAHLLPVETSKVKTKKTEEKIADVVCLIILGPCPPAQNSNGGYLIVKSTWPKENEDMAVYRSSTSQLESTASCHTLLQDQRGCDNADIFLAEIERVTVLMAAPAPRPLDNLAGGDQPSAPQAQQGQGQNATRRSRKRKQDGTVAKEKSFERGAQAVRLDFKQSLFGERNRKKSQFLSFITSEGAKGGVSLEYRRKKSYNTEIIKNEFLKSQRGKGTWITIRDPRRLLALPAAVKNPKPAPHGGRHSARKMERIPGMGSILYAGARKITDYIYDSVCMRGMPESQLIAIPLLAKAKGVSARSQHKLDLKIKRMQKKGQDVTQINPVTTVPNQRAITLLVDYSNPGRMVCVPLPCHLSGQERDYKKYGSLLKTLANGWYCWPEMWCRLITEFIKTDHFQKAETAYLRTLNKTEPRNFYLVSACVITDIPCIQRAAGKAMQSIKMVCGRGDEPHTKATYPMGTVDGFWMGSERKDGHFSTILYGHKDLGTFARDLTEIVENVIPEIVKKHQLFDRRGVTGVSVRFQLKSLLALVGEEPNPYSTGRLARFLQKMGRKEMMIGVLRADKTKEKEFIEKKAKKTSRARLALGRTARIQKQKEGKKEKKTGWGTTTFDLYLRGNKKDKIREILTEFRESFQ